MFKSTLALAVISPGLLEPDLDLPVRRLSRVGAVHQVLLLEELTGGVNLLQLGKAVALGFDTGQDGPGQVTGDAVGLDQDEGALSGHNCSNALVGFRDKSTGTGLWGLRLGGTRGLVGVRGFPFGLFAGALGGFPVQPDAGADAVPPG